MGLQPEDEAPGAGGMGAGETESYFLVGMLLGLAIYNGILLDLRLPRPVFKKLLVPPPAKAQAASAGAIRGAGGAASTASGVAPAPASASATSPTTAAAGGSTAKASAANSSLLSLGLADLREVNPLLASGMQQLLAYGGGNDEAVFGLTFETTLEAFGAPVSIPLVPGGAEKPVTAGNKWEYARALVDWHLNRSVARTFAALRRGFTAVLSPHFLGVLRPEELELLVVGTSALDFSELEAACVYDGGYTPVHPTVKAFWRVAHGLREEDKRRLLVFVTAAPKAPIGGLRNLAFKIQRNGGDSDRLPTASTCFNTLLLPEYASEGKLKERLTKAISECTGFGLK